LKIGTVKATLYFRT